jgi:hypothetical protein
MRKALVLFTHRRSCPHCLHLREAQNAITQNGSVIVGELGVFRGDRQLGGTSQHLANTGLGS